MKTLEYDNTVQFGCQFSWGSNFMDLLVLSAIIYEVLYVHGV